MRKETMLEPSQLSAKCQARDDNTNPVEQPLSVFRAWLFLFFLFFLFLPSSHSC